MNIKQFVEDSEREFEKLLTLEGGDVDVHCGDCKNILKSFTSSKLRELIGEVRLGIEMHGHLYQKDMFADPWEGWQKDIDELAKSKGFRIDNVSAWYSRWMIEKVLHLLDEAGGGK